MLAPHLIPFRNKKWQAQGKSTRQTSVNHDE